MPRTYLAVDLKSFYASVECIERGLDPPDHQLGGGRPEPHEKTICLAVTPNLKAWGISGRARLFEVVQRVEEVNARRLRAAPGRQFIGFSMLQGSCPPKTSRSSSLDTFDTSNSNFVIDVTDTW